MYNNHALMFFFVFHATFAIDYLILYPIFEAVWPYAYHTEV